MVVVVVVVVSARRVCSWFPSLLGLLQRRSPSRRYSRVSMCKLASTRTHTITHTHMHSHSHSHTHTDIPTIVLDIGSNSIKCGYAGEDAPRVVISSVVGAVKNDSIMDLEKHKHIKDYYVGDDVWAFKDLLAIKVRSRC
jgi:hypothetical protein